MEPFTTTITIVTLTQKLLDLAWHNRRQRSALRKEINQKLSEWAAQALTESKRLDAYVELDMVVSQMKRLISNILEDGELHDQDDTFWRSVKRDHDLLLEMANGRLTDFNIDRFGVVSRVRIDERKRTALQNVNAQAHRAGEVIRRMRDFTKSHESIRQRTKLTSLIEDVLSLARLDARANNIALEVDVPEDLPAIVADELQIQQVVLNLLRNGVDAMCDAKAEDRRLRLAAHVIESNKIQVDVVDCGEGVPEEARNELFNAFFTTKQSGMGMGLAISRTIVEAHGGELTFTNNQEAGATFSFTIPTMVGD